jgi:hypothetical protein
MVGCFTLLYSQNKIFDNFYTKLHPPPPEDGNIISKHVGWSENFITCIARVLYNCTGDFIKFIYEWNLKCNYVRLGE